MDLGSINFGSLTIPIFIASLSKGWTAHRTFIGKPLQTRLERLEAREEAYRREKDEELQMLRQKVLK